MPKIVKVIFIRAPAERVFDFATDPERAREYIPHVIEMKKTSAGPVGVGARYRSLVEIVGVRLAAPFRVTQYERPFRYATQGTHFEARGKSEWTFEPEEDGTKVTLSIDYTLPESFFGKWVGRFLVHRILERDLEQAMRNAKAILEGS